MTTAQNAGPQEKLSEVRAKTASAKNESSLHPLSAASGHSYPASVGTGGHDDPFGFSAAHPLAPLRQSLGNQAILRGLSQARPKIGLARSTSAPVLQRKCSCGGECSNCKTEMDGHPAIQTKLTVGPAGDFFEVEADRVADQVMNSPASAQSMQAEKPGAQLQRRPLSQSITPLARVSSNSRDEPLRLADDESRFIERAAEGSALPESVRAFMEPRFGADFRGVRLHTDSTAARMNDRLHSQAFTYGRDIWLGSGESPWNISLLAHELTHVVQQSPSVIQSGISPQSRVQRKNSYFSLMGDHEGGAGSKTHDFAFGEIAKRNKNKGLFFEVNIPGANKDRTADFVPDEDGVIGRADFFHASTTIGVKFVGENLVPEYLGSSRELRIAGGEIAGLSRFQHAKLAAPIGKHESTAAIPKKFGGKGKMPKAVVKDCPDLEPPAICRMGSAPASIALGDLKAPSDAEIRLGERQLENYGTGIRSTAGKVNQFATANPSKVDAPGPWNPTVTKLGEDDVEIPDKFKPNSTAGKPLPVVKYRNEKPDILGTPKGLRAYLYIIYAKDHPGIWKYEYVPVEVPKDTKESKAEADTLEKLTPIEDALKAKPDVQMKQKSNSVPVGRRIQRRIDKSFDYEAWVPNFKTWQRKDAEPFLQSREGVAAGFLETLADIKSRSVPQLILPAETNQIVAGEQKIHHWDSDGSWFGRLRWMFGDIYVKFGRLYSWARDKFRKLLPSSREGSGGGLGGKLVKVGMKILRYIAYIILGEVAERMKTAFRNAAESVIYNLFGKEIAEYEEFVNTVKGYVADFEATLKQGIAEKIEEVIRPFLDIVGKIEEIVNFIKDTMNWINDLKWVIRGLSCLEPPAFGCLWGLMGSELVLAIGEYIAGTCKFRKTMAKAIKLILWVKELPGKIADFLIDKLRTILPQKVQELIGSPDKKEVDLSSVEGCEDYDERPPRSLSEIRGGLSPEDREMFDKMAPNADRDPSAVAAAIVRLAKKWQDHPGHPLPALRKLMEATGFGIAFALTLSDLQRIDDFLEAVGGDGPAILKHVQNLGLGFARDRTLELVLKEAQESILHPVRGFRGKQKEPKPEDIQREGGVVIFKW